MSEKIGEKCREAVPVRAPNVKAGSSGRRKTALGRKGEREKSPMNIDLPYLDVVKKLVAKDGDIDFRRTMGRTKGVGGAWQVGDIPASLGQEVFKHSPARGGTIAVPQGRKGVEVTPNNEWLRAKAGVNLPNGQDYRVDRGVWRNI